MVYNVKRSVYQEDKEYSKNRTKLKVKFKKSNKRN